MKKVFLPMGLIAIAFAMTTASAKAPATTEYRDRSGQLTDKKNAYYEAVITNYGDSVREELYEIKDKRLRQLNTYSIYTPDKRVRHGIQQTYDKNGNVTQETIVDSKAGTEDTWKWNADGKAYIHIVTNSQKGSEKVWKRLKDGGSSTTITDSWNGKKRVRTMVKSDKKQELSYIETQDGKETEVRYTSTDGHRYYRYPMQTGDTLWLDNHYCPVVPDSATQRFTVAATSADSVRLARLSDKGIIGYETLTNLNHKGNGTLLHREMYYPSGAVSSKYWTVNARLARSQTFYLNGKLETDCHFMRKNANTRIDSLTQWYESGELKREQVILRREEQSNMETVKTIDIDLLFDAGIGHETKKVDIIKGFARLQGVDRCEKVLKGQCYDKDGKSIEFLICREGNGNATLEESSVFNDVDVLPQYPGGNAAMQDFIKKKWNMTWGKIDFRKSDFLKHFIKEIDNLNGLQTHTSHGCVFLTFIIEKDGSIGDINVLRSPLNQFSQEAIRIVQAMPKWEPGLLNDQPVRVKYLLPVIFSFE